MGLYQGYQRRSMKQAQEILGAEVKVLDHAPGYAGPHPYLTAAAMVGAVMLLALLTGRLPGVLLIILAGYTVNKPRAVVLTGRELTVFKRSVLLGKLTAPLSTLPAAALAVESGPAQLGYLRIPLGSERVWIREKDQRRMTSGARA